MINLEHKRLYIVFMALFTLRIDMMTMILSIFSISPSQFVIGGNIPFSIKCRFFFNLFFISVPRDACIQHLHMCRIGTHSKQQQQKKPNLIVLNELYECRFWLYVYFRLFWTFTFFFAFISTLNTTTPEIQIDRWHRRTFYSFLQCGWKTIYFESVPNHIIIQQ